MKFIFFVLAFLICTPEIFAQNNIGIGTNSPNAAAILEIKSNSKGLLMPRLGATARKNMPNVPKGMIVFDSSYNHFYFHDGGRWRPITDNNQDSLLVDYSAIPQVTTNMNGNSGTDFMSGLLNDNGGAAGNYSGNRNDTYTITQDGKDAATIVIGYKVVIEEMNTEAPYDSLEIFTGIGSSQKQLFSGSRVGVFFFQNNGPLVLKFKSNAANHFRGFKIRWTKLVVDSTTTETAPLYGWYFNNTKIAIRGGINLNNEWAKDSLGILSFGYGSKNRSRGYLSKVFGQDNEALGDHTFITGRANRAEKSFSIAMGSFSSATGFNAVAFGDGTLAEGDYSFAAGQYTRALARHSVALGEFTLASDYDAFAMGNGTVASGWGSAAFGNGSVAGGGAAFAAGNTTTAGADFATVFGSLSKATGVASFAAGDRAEASNKGSLALGTQVIAGGSFAVAIGNNTQAIGTSSVALGSSNNASGNYSMAAGVNSVASGVGSVSIGSSNTSSAGNATAIGTALNVAGQYATAFGSKITIPVASPGSLGIGDLEFSNDAIDNTSIGNPNEFVARFRGGYFFMSSANAPGGDYSSRTGVKIGPGQNSWSAISDKRRKENFEPVNGEIILKKIAAIPLTTWNYKAQDPKTFRHYGPMAQDFFSAFGKDSHGTIGCDTLINQQDFLGVNFIAIQALEKRTDHANQEIQLLKEQVAMLKNSNELLVKKIAQLTASK